MPAGAAACGSGSRARRSTATCSSPPTMSAGSTSSRSAAPCRPIFVAKADVEQWPVDRLGGRAQRHVFIARDVRSSVRGQADDAARRAGRRPRRLPVPGRDDRRRPGRAALPRQPVRLALPAAARRHGPAGGARLSATPSTMSPGSATRPMRVNVEAHPVAPRHARRSRSASSTRSIPPRPATARSSPPGARGGHRRAAGRRAIAAAGPAASASAGRSPIGARNEDPRPKTFHVKSFGCQMNVYDGERMAELLEAEGMTPRADARRRRSRRAQHLPHPRESGREGLFGHRPADEARDGARADDRGRRLRRPGRGRGDPAPRARRRHRRRPAGLSQPAGAGPRGGGAAARALDTDMPAALQVRRAAGAAPAGAERLPHRPGRLRQILHLLRRPLYARRRDLAAVRGDRRRGEGAGRRAARRRSPCSARTSTPGAAETARASTI